MRLVRALDHHRRVTAVPSQKPGILADLGLSREQAEAAAWAIEPDGRRHRGAAAVNAALAAALGTALPLRFYGLPGVRSLQDRVYAWVATHRSHFPGDAPYCKQHPDECA